MALSYGKYSFDFLPKHTVADRSQINHNGAMIPEHGIFIHSGTVGPITSNTTGSVTLSFNAYGIKLRRIEVFHSGTSTDFNVRVESSTPNTGSFFDPLEIGTCYDNIPGSTTYQDGLDQIEDLYILTDRSTGNKGNVYVKFMPHANLSGNNYFKYLIFSEAVMIYTQGADVIHG